MDGDETRVMKSECYEKEDSDFGGHAAKSATRLHSDTDRSSSRRLLLFLITMFAILVFSQATHLRSCLFGLVDISAAEPLPVSWLSAFVGSGKGDGHNKLNGPAAEGVFVYDVIPNTRTEPC